MKPKIGTLVASLNVNIPGTVKQEVSPEIATSTMEAALTEYPMMFMADKPTAERISTVINEELDAAIDRLQDRLGGSIDPHLLNGALLGYGYEAMLRGVDSMRRGYHPLMRMVYLRTMLDAMQFMSTAGTMMNAAKAGHVDDDHARDLTKAVWDWMYQGDAETWEMTQDILAKHSEQYKRHLQGDCDCAAHGTKTRADTSPAAGKAATGEIAAALDEQIAKVAATLRIAKDMITLFSNNKPVGARVQAKIDQLEEHLAELQESRTALNNADGNTRAGILEAKIGDDGKIPDTVIDQMLAQINAEAPVPVSREQFVQALEEGLRTGKPVAIKLSKD